MKKIAKKSIFIGVLILSFILSGCDKDIPMREIVDYRCTTDYLIENKSDKTITVIIVNGYMEDSEISQRMVILPGKKKKIYMESEMCGVNTVVNEFEGEILPIVLNNVSVNVYADNLLIKKNLLDKNNWIFTAEKYYKATYLLLLTNDLIESVGYDL